MRIQTATISTKELQDALRIQTATISTKELQDALRIYCADKGGIPDTVIVQSYEKQIVVDLAPSGMITTDEFHHAATGA